MEFALEKSDIEPKGPVEEPIAPEALVEVPTNSKILKTTELEPMLKGINLTTKHEAQELSMGKSPQVHVVGGRPTPPCRNPGGGLADTFNPQASGPYQEVLGRPAPMPAPGPGPAEVARRNQEATGRRPSHQ